jgi:glycosyltransferase involved in cell wall biosynthesis
MNVCLMTNTYLPHVGGVARSVSTFAAEFRRLGHGVLVVAPRFPGRPPPPRVEALVERLPAIQNFNDSGFSVRLPLAAGLSARLEAFRADIIHAHHPFLLGDTALRVAAAKDVPIVFTHHTRYEDYVHYLPFESEALEEIAAELPTRFANLCDGVIAPSESVARLLRRRGVEVPVRVVPTGVDVAAFAGGDRAGFRARHGLPARAFVAGTVSRLAPEKNLEHLAAAAVHFLRRQPAARFLVVGDGPAGDALRARFARAGVADRVALPGRLTGRALCAAYAAMDAFAFASRTETQGMVVAEAMAAGLPVAALAATGVREVVRDGRNGFLVPPGSLPARLGDRLADLAADPALRRRLAAGARATAAEFAQGRCAAQALDFYAELRRMTRPRRLAHRLKPWEKYLDRLAVEWDLLAAKTQVVATALLGARGGPAD